MLQMGFDEGLRVLIEKILNLRHRGRRPAVSIAGASQSGKSFLAKQITDLLVCREIGVIRLGMDDYYKTKQELLVEGLIGNSKEPQFDFDSPSAVDLELLAKDVELLKTGEDIRLRRYVYPEATGSGFPTAFRVFRGTAKALSGEVILVEGLFVHSSIIREVVDFAVFVDQPDPAKRMANRIRRDVQERGFSAAASRERWQSFVEPNTLAHIRPADFAKRFKVDLWICNPY